MSQKTETSDDDEDEVEENEDEVNPSLNPHVISVFDLRKCTDPVLTIKVGSSINRVGCLSKRLIYACTDDNKCSVFVPNAPDDVDYLFMRNGTEGRFLVDALKGGVDERPVALIECDAEGTVYVRTVSKDGKHSEVVMEWKGLSRISSFLLRSVMSRALLFSIVVATVLAKLQNVTVKIGEVTCGNEDYLDSLKLQALIIAVKDDLLGEMYFNVSHPPQNISFVASENEYLTLSPYLIFQHTCNGPCVRSRHNIPKEYVGGVYVESRVELNGTFDDTKPC
ncbi:Transthyretin-like family protein [Teladorsagia circumcincta]|uniref:Transthyretin-like family protein n=1 Tax=Teladorsagia circumcincta TaxID=45464 RepID=A0A2G9UJF1_TELCI|nr:Transthyretin-like family protein [Teladorsagia circumcincta]